jgi:hypothetical protein
MKNKHLIILGLMLALPILLFSQIPNSFRWQGNAKDANGNAVQGSVALRFSLLNAANNTNSLYSEIHNTTASSGQLVVNIGEGGNKIGAFPTDWATGAFFLKVEMAIGGGTNFIAMGAPSQLLAVPFALYAASAGGGGSSSWQVSANNIVNTNSGNVLIGTNTPTSGKVSIKSKWEPTSPTRKTNLDLGDFTTNYNATPAWDNYSGSISFYGGGWHNGFLTFIPHAPDGNSYFKLAGESSAFDDVKTGLFMKGPLRVAHRHTNNSFSIELGDNTNYNTTASTTNYSGSILFNGAGWQNGFLTFIPHHPDGNSYFKFGGVSFGFDDSRTGIITKGRIGINTDSPTTDLDVVGRAKVQVLEITGADIIEKANATESLLPGEVVVWDDTKPNVVKRSTDAYNKQVFGVVSGANNLPHGVELVAPGVLDGNTNIAIAGRVYVKVVGDVQSGDLLTTSKIAGHAMKSKNRKKERGAIIGKALSKPDKNGLVLMLVNIQ